MDNGVTDGASGTAVIVIVSFWYIVFTVGVIVKAVVERVKSSTPIIEGRDTLDILSVGLFLGGGAAAFTILMVDINQEHWAVWILLLPWPVAWSLFSVRWIVRRILRIRRVETLSRGHFTSEDVLGYPENWDDIRRQVYARDGYRCANCGARDIKLHAHHVVPLRAGGTNSLSNLKTLCADCHALIHPHMRD